MIREDLRWIEEGQSLTILKCIVNFSHDDAVSHASQASGQDPRMFSQAMQYAQGQQHQDVDEQGLQDAHQQAYSGNAGNMAPGGVGAAAALQALKHFTSSGGNTGGSGGGSMQSQLIAQAMAEASSLFDKSGNTGNKQEAVSSAASSMMKMMMMSQLGGGGGGGAGGLGGMLCEY